MSVKQGKDALNELHNGANDGEQGERLRLVLKVRYQLDKRDMTQAKLAELTGIRPNAISTLARGYVDRLTIDHIERIAQALDITDIRELIELMPESEARQYDY